jgi:hypothetical protein
VNPVTIEKIREKLRQREGLTQQEDALWLLAFSTGGDRRIEALRQALFYLVEHTPSRDMLSVLQAVYDDPEYDHLGSATKARVRQQLENARPC